MITRFIARIMHAVMIHWIFLQIIMKTSTDVTVVALNFNVEPFTERFLSRSCKCFPYFPD